MRGYREKSCYCQCAGTYGDSEEMMRSARETMADLQADMASASLGSENATYIQELEAEIERLKNQTPTPKPTTLVEHLLEEIQALKNPTQPPVPTPMPTTYEAYAQLEKAKIELQQALAQAQTSKLQAEQALETQQAAQEKVDDG